MITKTYLLGKVALLIVGCLWVHGVYDRFHHDLEEFRDPPDEYSKVIIAGIWAVTLVILGALLYAGYAMANTVYQFATG